MNDCVAECFECGQDVPVQGPSPGASASTLRALLGRVAAGAVTPEAAARLIESWPTPPTRREPSVGELGLCGGAPADDAMRWTPADDELREDDPDDWSEVDDARKSRDDLIRERDVMRRAWRQEQERRKGVARALSAARPAAEPDAQMVVGKAGVPIDAYDAIQLLATRPDHPSRLLAEKARAVADWVNDPPGGLLQRGQVDEIAPELVEKLFDLLGGGPGDVSDARPAAGPVGDDTTTEYRATGTDREGIGAVSDWMPTEREAHDCCRNWQRYGITDLAVESRTVTTTTTVSPWAPVDEQDGAQA